jgi:hypothetical protein
MAPAAAGNAQPLTEQQAAGRDFAGAPLLRNTAGVMPLERRMLSDAHISG